MSCLSALLTAPLAQRLHQLDPTPLLVLLSGSLESSTAIWSTGMRDELLHMLHSIRKVRQQHWL